VALLLLSLALLLVVLHRRFRTGTGRYTRAGVVVAAVVAGYSYIVAVTSVPNVCAFPLQHTNDSHECYNPRDPAQFSRHLKECKIVPGKPPPAAPDAPNVDHRAVPCDYFDQFQNRPLPASPALARH